MNHKPELTSERPEMPEQASHIPRRHWLRFSVRALMILILVSGCALGFLVHRAHLQRDAVVAIKRASGIVLYDWECKNGRYASNGRPLAPKWLVERIGLDYFDHVSYVQLGEGSSDAELVYVGQLNQLDKLVVNNRPVTDAGLSHLKGLSHLRMLILAGTEITDAGLAHLSRLPRLQRLDLIDTRISAAGAQKLQKSLPEMWIIRR